MGLGAWAAVLYSTVLASGFAIAAWQVNVSRLGANGLLVYMYLMTLFGLTFSVLLLGEGSSVEKVSGAAVILLGACSRLKGEVACEDVGATYPHPR